MRLVSRSSWTISWPTFATLCLAATLPLAGSAWRIRSRDLLVPTLKHLAGRGARDCSFSHLPPGQKKWDEMLGCSANSFTLHRAFWVVENGNPNSSDGEHGVALGLDGVYYRVHQTHPLWRLAPQIEITRSASPQMGQSPPKGQSYMYSDGHIQATPQQSATPNY